MGLYERFVLPPVIACLCGCEPIRMQREKVVPLADGVVLELGFGTGLNLPHYDAAKVTRLYALEPAKGMLVRARKAAPSAPFPVEVLAETAERLSLPPASIDTVVVTYALCTIPDGVAALAAARRALKPCGRLLFCEHGSAPDESVRRWQRRIEPVWRRLAGGCHLTRDIPAMLVAAGFRPDRLESTYLPRAPRFAGFNVWGSAVPV